MKWRVFKHNNTQRCETTKTANAQGRKYLYAIAITKILFDEFYSCFCHRFSVSVTNFLFMTLTFCFCHWISFDIIKKMLNLIILKILQITILTVFLNPAAFGDFFWLLWRAPAVSCINGFLHFQPTTKFWTLFWSCHKWMKGALNSNILFWWGPFWPSNA